MVQNQWTLPSRYIKSGLFWSCSSDPMRIGSAEKEGKVVAELPGGHIFHLANLPCFGHRQFGHLFICYSVPAAKDVCCQGDEIEFENFCPLECAKLGEERNY